MFGERHVSEFQNKQLNVQELWSPSNPTLRIPWDSGGGGLKADTAFKCILKALSMVTHTHFNYYIYGLKEMKVKGGM